MRSFEEVRPIILTKLLEHFTQRMSIDAGLLRSLEPLSNHGTSYTRDRIQECHSVIISDLDLRGFAAAYKDFTRSASLAGLDIRELTKKAVERPE